MVVQARHHRTLIRISGCCNVLLLLNWRYGWLQHFLNCMTMFNNLVLPSFFPVIPGESASSVYRVANLPLTASMSFSNNILYHFLCISVIPTYRLISFLGNNECSTSAFTRLSKKGLRTLCSCLTTASGSESSFVLNHASKSSLTDQLVQLIQQMGSSPRWEDIW